ncbi:MAG: DUF427 domain-containing protein [Egibacteraceae bacterium]
MALTVGTGPFGRQSSGEFNFTREGPAHVLYWEDSPKRVRVRLGSETVADSRHVKLLHETGLMPVYYFPRADVREELLEATDHTTHCPFKGDASYWTVRTGDAVAENAVWGYPDPLEHAPPLQDHVAFSWQAMDAWLEEDEEVGVHARDPYHRIDVLSSSRHVVVKLDGEVLADSTRPLILLETGLPPRYYLPREDIRVELEPSETHSGCPYKGTASYFHVAADGQRYDDLAWTYPDPLPESLRIRDLICFYDEKVDTELDDEAQPRPETKFA